MLPAPLTGSGRRPPRSRPGRTNAPRVPFSRRDGRRDVLLPGRRSMGPAGAVARQEDVTALCTTPEPQFEPTVTVENLFTGRTADERNEDEVTDNPVVLEAEADLALLTPEETGGWVGAHLDMIDELSPATRAEDDRLFTHKLDCEPEAALVAFNGLPEGSWIRNVEVEASLDYVVTGPARGRRRGVSRRAVLPRGRRVGLAHERADGGPGT